MSFIRRNARGFSLTELMLIVTIAGTIMAIALPVTTELTASTKLSEAARLVEREFQDARLRAVSSNRSLRVRTNCPAVGFVRSVEVLGTAADAAADRCLQSAYPFPADTDVMTRPNYDGPVRFIPNAATATTATIEFSPDGTARLVDAAGVAQPMAAEQTITVTRQSKSRTVMVNGAGKVQIQ
ncbi:MAG: GspH/FimT family pseudopilin [Acidobacteria bacterium]|nr:GspH/FimT family pseudopilin [Acidobacteriota bacterium]